MEPDDELDLLGCFGVEPDLLDAGIPWCFNTATYRVELDGLDVAFSVQPAYCRISLEVFRGRTRLFTLNADWVSELRVIDEPNVDAVHVVLNERAWLRLQLRPVFEVIQGFTSAD